MRILANFILAIPISLMGVIFSFIGVTLIRLIDPQHRQLLGDVLPILNGWKGQNSPFLLILLTAAITNFVGVIVGWTVHTRKLPGKLLLISMFVLPMAVPYEALSLSVRNLDLQAKLAVFVILFTRYFPVAFLLSWMAVSQFSTRALATAKNLGISELSFLGKAVLPRLILPITAQFLFLSLLFSCDATGIQSASSGRLYSFGSEVYQWTRSVDNRDVGFLLAVATALLGGLALGCSNVIGWWKQTVVRRPLESPLGASLDGSCVFAWSLGSALIGITILPAFFGSSVDLGRALITFGSEINKFILDTSEFLLLGFVLIWLTTMAVYTGMQERNEVFPIMLVLAVASSTIVLISPPIVRGDLFLAVTSWGFGKSGNIVWVAVWSWLYTLPVVATLVALHPLSRSSRFLQMTKNLEILFFLRLRLAARNSVKVFFGAFCTFVFLTLFDTSIARELSGFSKPLAIWFSDKTVTTLDRDMIAFSIVLSITILGFLLLFVYLTSGREKRV
jgi:ABC-type spermidine/putrescine transport system permease subunit II